jgi:hypothetical protein
MSEVDNPLLIEKAGENCGDRVLRVKKLIRDFRPDRIAQPCHHGWKRSSKRIPIRPTSFLGQGTAQLSETRRKRN